MKLFIAIMDAIDKFDAFTKTSAGKNAIVAFTVVAVLALLIYEKKRGKK